MNARREEERAAIGGHLGERVVEQIHDVRIELLLLFLEVGASDHADRDPLPQIAQEFEHLTVGAE